MNARSITYSEAIREAIAQEMGRDPNVIVIGQGATDHTGIYGTTTGLADEFGKHRVMDAPLSEEGVTGVVIGAAMSGLRPINFHIRMDFLLLATNQIVNIAAKNHYMYGGQVRVPIVIRAVIGRSWGQGAQHSQGLHAMFSHIPGLKVIAPVTPYDAKGCMTEAIRDNNPVLCIEHRMVHGQQGEVPGEAYTCPFGKARILAKGNDITIVGISHMAVEAMRAVKKLEDIGISAEVIDPVTVQPLDIDTIVESVMKTGRLLVGDTAWTFCGVSGEILAQVSEHLGSTKAIPMKRLGFAPVPCPTTRPLEDVFYPSAHHIATAAYELVRPDDSPWQPETETAPEIIEFKGPF